MTNSRRNPQTPDQARRSLRTNILAGSAIAAVAILGGPLAVHMLDGRKSRADVAARQADERLSVLLNELATNYPGTKPVKIWGGVLDGRVEIDITTVSGVHSGGYSNPIVLSRPNINASPKSTQYMDGAWIAVPGTNAQGNPTFTKSQVQVGQNGDTDTTIQINNLKQPIMNSAELTIAPVDGVNGLFAIDTTGKMQTLQIMPDNGMH